MVVGLCREPAEDRGVLLGGSGVGGVAELVQDGCSLGVVFSIQKLLHGMEDLGTYAGRILAIVCVV